MADEDLDFAIALSLSESMTHGGNSKSRDSRTDHYVNNDVDKWYHDDLEYATPEKDQVGAPLIPIHKSLPKLSNVSSSGTGKKTFENINSSDYKYGLDERKSPVSIDSNQRHGNKLKETQEDADFAFALSLSLNESGSSSALSIPPTPPSVSNDDPYGKLPPSKRFPVSANENKSNTSNSLHSRLSNFINPYFEYTGVSSSSLDVCNSCKKPLGFSNVTIGQYSYHRNCAKCAACNQLLDGTIAVRDDGLYHSSCADVLFSPYCCLCSNRLSGKYFRHMFFTDEKYCSTHLNSKECSSCRRKEPLPSSRREGFVDLPDGRVSCIECISTAILDSSEAQPIYQEILNFYTSVLHLPIPAGMKDIPVLAVDVMTMNDNVSTAGPKNNHLVTSNVRGLTISSVGHINHMTPGSIIWDPMTNTFKVRQGEVFSVSERRSISAILVLYGLPRDLTASILAHESMHAWLRLQKSISLHLPSKVEEGLCQVIAKKYLEHIGETNGSAYDHASRRLKEYFEYSIEADPDPIYGDGYREVKASVDALSLEVVLDYIREHSKIPAV